MEDASTACAEIGLPPHASPRHVECVELLLCLGRPAISSAKSGSSPCDPALAATACACSVSSSNLSSSNLSSSNLSSSNLSSSNLSSSNLSSSNLSAPPMRAQPSGEHAFGGSKLWLKAKAVGGRQIKLRHERGWAMITRERQCRGRLQSDPFRCPLFLVRPPLPRTSRGRRASWHNVESPIGALD